MSLMCCGRNLFGPPAEPLGKDLIARATSARSVEQVLAGEEGGWQNLEEVQGALTGEQQGFIFKTCQLVIRGC